MTPRVTLAPALLRRALGRALLIPVLAVAAVADLLSLAGCLLGWVAVEASKGPRKLVS